MSTDVLTELVTAIRLHVALTMALDIDPNELQRGGNKRPVVNMTLESILLEVDNAISKLPVEVFVEGRSPS